MYQHRYHHHRHQPLNPGPDNPLLQIFKSWPRWWGWPTGDRFNAFSIEHFFVLFSAFFTFTRSKPRWWVRGLPTEHRSDAPGRTGCLTTQGLSRFTYLSLSFIFPLFKLSQFQFSGWSQGHWLGSRWPGLGAGTGCDFNCDFNKNCNENYFNITFNFNEKFYFYGNRSTLTGINLTQVDYNWNI